MKRKRHATLADEWDSFVVAAVPVSLRETTTVVAELRKVFMAGVLVGCDHMQRGLVDRDASASLMDELMAYHEEQRPPGGRA